MGSNMEIFEARVLGEDHSFWLKNHQYWELCLVYACGLQLSLSWMGSYMEIFEASVLGGNLSFWLKNHQYWELCLVYAITLVNMDRFE